MVGYPLSSNRCWWRKISRVSQLLSSIGQCEPGQFYTFDRNTVLLYDSLVLLRLWCHSSFQSRGGDFARDFHQLVMTYDSKADELCGLFLSWLAVAKLSVVLGHYPPRGDGCQLDEYFSAPLVPFEVESSTLCMAYISTWNILLCLPIHSECIFLGFCNGFVSGPSNLLLV